MSNRTPEQTDAVFKSGTNILVSAGAGSGKTTVLTDRVIEKLKKGIHIDQLLILTFTNAAAAEMKERIRKKIEECSLTEEIEKIDTAYITTFDSFCLSIVKKYYYKKNISPNPIILDNAVMDMIKLKKIREIFDCYYEEKDEAFLTLIDTFCIKDDKDLLPIIKNLYNKTKQRYNRKQYFDTYTQYYYGKEFKEILEKEYNAFLDEKLELIKQMIKDLSLYTNGTFIEKIENSLSGVFMHQFHTFPERLTPLPNNSSEDAKKLKEELKKTLEDFKSIAAVPFETHYQEFLMTKNTVSILIKILQKLDEELEVFKQEHNCYEFIDIELLAISIIEENQDICASLKGNFQEIMIDEYQDTNDLQEYLINMIANHNVYMVGDIKQAIYRFRNANPYLFKEKYEAYKKNQGGIKIDLNKNFRSRKEVIEDINHIFNALMTPSFGEADYKLEHQMSPGNQMYEENPVPESHLEIFTTNQDEAIIIASDIHEKLKNHYQVVDKETKSLRDCKLSDFTILLDRTTRIENYVEAFEKYGLPMYILRDEAVKENDLFILLKEMYVSLFCTDEGKEKFYYTSIARSFLFEKSDEEIYHALKKGNYQTSEIMTLLKEIKKSISINTASQLLEKIIKDFKIEENIYKIGQMQNNQKVIEVLKNITYELETLGFLPNEVAQLLEEMETNNLDIKIAATKTTEEKIELMNIHKSKGLEFPICYYAGLTKKFNIDDLKDVFYYDNSLGFIVPIMKEGIKDTILKVLLKNNYMKEEISEKIRLLYVALTRAKEKMIFVMPPFGTKNVSKNRLKHKSFYDFYTYIENVLAPFTKEAKVNIVQKQVSPKKEKIEKFIVEELAIKPILKEEHSFSKKMHSLLPDNVKQNINFGLKIHELFEAADLKKEQENPYLIRFLKQELLQNIKNATIYQEYEFIDKETHGIIDLLLEYEDHIDIIDYKLKDIHDENYIEQLKGYQSYIASIQSKPVYIYLYSILEDSMEEIQ